ncbi:O-antigen ligase family protein [Pseudoalteromonas sp. SG44-17]|nr:O-antigen ligase family protein [Pseudoalteromonas sp. SG44-17]
MKNPLVMGEWSISPIIYFCFVIIALIFFLGLFGRGYTDKNVLIITIIMLFSLIPSVFLSEYIVVSILKYIPFFCGIIMLSLLSSRLTFADEVMKRELFRKILNTNRIVLGLSVFILFIGAGYPRNETGFAGFFNHPQAFGIYLLYFMLFELVSWRTNVSGNLSSCFFIVLIFAMSYMTESRLSLGSNMIFLLTYFFMFGKLTLYRKIVFSVLALVTVFLLYDILMDVTLDVLSKRGRANSYGVEALLDSRFRFVEGSILNFLDNPFSGIGFQVSNGKYGHYPMDLTPSAYFNLPLNASIEKGVFWSALPEESGLIGLIGVFFFFVATILLRRSIFIVMPVLGLFLLGFGEAFLFSLGGVGFFVWVVFYFFLSFKKNDFIVN